jgi:hypothetical protein
MFNYCHLPDPPYFSLLSTLKTAEKSVPRKKFLGNPNVYSVFRVQTQCISCSTDVFLFHGIFISDNVLGVGVWGRESDTELLVQTLDLFESLPCAYTFSEKCGQNPLEKWFLRWLFVGSV